MKLTEQDKVIFTIGDCEDRFVGYDLDSTWNGFDNVAVTKEVHKKLFAWCKANETEVDPKEFSADDQGLYHWCNGWAIEIDEEMSPDTYAIVMVKVNNTKPTEWVQRRPENSHYEGIKSELVAKLSKVLGSESIDTWWIDDIHNQFLQGS
tara:strand:+ start:701 stop:1150 length:450 start_codon:yes stop_codon:yes gene_type:complete